MQRFRYLSLAICVTTLAAGCGSETQRGPLDAASYAALPGMKSSHHAQLRDELARLVAERGTPLLLSTVVPGDQATTPSSTGPAGSAQANAAVALRQIFPPDRIESIAGELDRMVPEALFPIDSVRLRSASAFRRTYEQHRLQYRQALDRPTCNFQLDHRQGLLGEIWFLEVLRLGNALESIWAAESVADGRLEQAVESLAYMLHATRWLAAESHLTTRLQATQLRQEALLVLEAICQHPDADRETQSHLLDLLQEQLAAWPEDSRAWIGERAQGLHAYEIIRDGYILSLFKFSEIERLRAEIQLTERLQVLPETIDNDQWFYARAMRRVIESCTLPYVERQQVIREINAELDELRETPRYPWIADRLLLGDLQLVHDLLAQDRALVEAWALALAVTTQRKPGVGKINPLTGHPWLARQKPTYVIVDDVVTMSGRPVSVPIPDSSSEAL